MQRSGWSAALATFLLVFGLTVRADNNPATSSVPHQFPYHGRLELNAAPVTGTVNMRFSLFNDATGGSAIWTEGHGLGGGNTVSVLGGAFMAVLGDTVAIGDVIFDADTLFLGIEVEDPNSHTVYPMAGRQQLFPATPLFAKAILFP